MKKLLFVFLILSGVGVSFLFYSWQKATQLPEWYTAQSKSTQNTLNLSNETEVIAAKARLEEKIEASIAKSLAEREATTLPLASPVSSQPNSFSQAIENSAEHEIYQSQNVEIELSDREVNELVMTTIAEQTDHSLVLANTLSFHTTIQDGIIESGAVVNLEDLPKNQLSERERATLEKMLETFPGLENKKFYVGISGSHRLEQGQFKLDDNTKIKIGNLSLSLSEVSAQLGISKERIEHKINQSLQLDNLKVNDLEVADDKVLLSGSLD